MEPLQQHTSLVPSPAPVSVSRRLAVLCANENGVGLGMRLQQHASPQLHTGKGVVHVGVCFTEVSIHSQFTVKVVSV